MPPAHPAPVKCLDLLDVLFGRFPAIVALVLIACSSHARAAQSVTLAWNASPSSDVAGYKVYYSTVSGGSIPFVDVGNVTTATISNLNEATTYYFSVTAYNAARIESQRSTEISYRTPSSAPEIYTLTVIRGSGSGPYPVGAYVPVSADPPNRGEEFAYWEGDTEILLGLLTSSNNEAFIPLQDVTISAKFLALPAYTVTVTNGTGDGNYFAGETVSIVAEPAPAGQQFAGWTGNVTVVNASSPTTTFTMPSSAVTVTATYTTASTSDSIRYYPRQGFPSRMNGGVFEGTNGDRVTGPYTAIHTIGTNPSLAWTTVNVNLGSYRYLRYRGPNDSYGNVAEIEFYRAGVKVAGTGFGTFGSWEDQGNTFAKALDGSTDTFFDAPTPDGNYVGVDTGSTDAVTYTLTVVDGTGDGNYPAGADVTVRGNYFGIGGVFAGWSGDTQYLADASARTTTLKMPAAPVKISATFR